MTSILALAVDGTHQGFPPLGEIAVWLQAMELSAWVPGRSGAPPAAEAVAAALPGVRTEAVRSPFASCSPSRPAGAVPSLAEPRQAPREQAQQEVLESARVARALGARWLILELGPLPRTAPLTAEDSLQPSPVSAPDLERFRQALASQEAHLLDRLCRVLYRLEREVAPVGLAIATPLEIGHLPTPGMLEKILEDLPARRIGYWHDTGRARSLARSGLAREEEWLDRFAARCPGVDLVDFGAGYSGLPAGAGEVDFVGVRSALKSDACRVIRAEPFPGPGPLSAAAQFLRGLGF